MERWDEMRTAYALGRLGTVSEAAEALDIHRATVVRHIDQLEDALGGKLFQRHARGYTLTEAGHDLMRVAKAAKEQFDALAGRTQGRKLEVLGEVVVTSVEVVAPFVIQAIARFRAAHPKTSVRYFASGRNYRLEYGEAHVAIRAGQKPVILDNVVQPFFVMRSGLYAHVNYVAQHGRPESPAEYADHAFIEDTREPLSTWGKGLVPKSNVVFSSGNERLTFQALQAGLGIAFYPAQLAARHGGLVEIHPPQPEWVTPFWLMTHVDLRHTAKVQAILEHLRTVAPTD